MQKLLYFFIISLLFASCSKTKTVEETAQNYVKSMLKNPDSFQLESIDVSEDTIPFFLDNNIMKAAKASYEAMEKYNRYKDRSYLWAQEKSEASSEFLASKVVLDALCKDDSKEPQVQYVVLMKSSGTNPMGGRVSSKEIVIVDKEDPKKVLGAFQVDQEFIRAFMMAMYCHNPNWDLKQNQFGKYETDGMSRIEKFIIDE